MRFSLVAPLVAATVAAAGCNLDLTNPNAPTEKEVFGTREGIVALTVGLQARYAAGMMDFIFPGGLVTDELGATPAALASYKDLETAAPLVNTADAVELPWRSHYRTVKTANDLLVHAPNLQAALGDSTLSGIITVSYLFKAMALGELVQQYKEIPIDTYNDPQPTFVDRATALAYVLALLDSAITQFRAVRPGSEFNTTIRAGVSGVPGLDVRNTIFAMIARYQRLAGNAAAARDAADSVALTVISNMPFSDQAINPIHDLSNRAGYVKPVDSLRLQAESADARIVYLVKDTAITGNAQPLDRFGQYVTNGAAIPIYLPGEVMLIRAEALLDLADIAGARTAVNAVRTKCGGAADQPKACLPALADTLLDTDPEIRAEIYRQRRFELFATGMRWEDARREGLVGVGSLAHRCWLLYPQSERNVNINVPADPEPAASPAFPATCF
ncbi:MAG TPA: RagB/SusD family nutrient uptake outer membrane protein [Gemmatimonadales bacterium]|jgi:ribosomal protein S9|nr:RagB/SusD family nutrient uptake outer membrane protein [Gemmatimonadales bacterium]